jgi:hypothetical protein
MLERDLQLEQLNQKALGGEPHVVGHIGRLTRSDLRKLRQNAEVGETFVRGTKIYI